MRVGIFASLVLVGLLSTGCVTKSTYELALDDLDQTRSSLSSAEATIGEQQGMIESNEAEIRRTKEELEELKRQKSLLEDGYAEAQYRLDDSADRLSESESRLNESKSQLEKMRLIEEETKKRNEIYARFVSELQKMIDGGQLTVSIEQGRIVINLPNNVLFASGHTSVNAAGQEALKQIGGVLKEFSDRRFQIEGHTDNVPIKSPRFPSNWELSTARALSVVHLMVAEGVRPENVSAAGFGEFQPRADNETKEGQALNRRIEIIMLPDLDILSNELPKVTQ